MNIAHESTIPPPPPPSSTIDPQTLLVDQALRTANSLLLLKWALEDVATLRHVLIEFRDVLTLVIITGPLGTVTRAKEAITAIDAGLEATRSAVGP